MPQPATDVVASEYYTNVCSIAISRCGLLELGDYLARGRTQQSSDLSIPIFGYTVAQPVLPKELDWRQCLLTVVFPQ